MRKTIHVLALIGMLICVVWCFVDFGFGSISAAVAGLIAYLSSFDRKEQAAVAIQPDDNLSENALRFLNAIEESEESDPKGISLMMMGSSVGLYRPFIWDNHLHGQISGHDGHDPSDAISAIDELEDSGFLIPHYEGDSLRQWRITRKPLPQS